MAAANENQWREFWQRLDAPGDALPPWLELQAAYSESWRAYHNLNHIGHCLGELATARQPAEEPLAIEAAIWFHDAIYDTQRKDNEERSADLAVEMLVKAGKPESFCQNVQALILATKHQAQPTSMDAQLLTDIDLSILGQSPERYTEFEQQIRQEYAWVPAGDFATGRSAILKSFLARPSIYNSSAFIQKYEEQARVNLTRAIEQLAGLQR